jgi:hypothetical protein
MQLTVCTWRNLRVRRRMLLHVSALAFCVMSWGAVASTGYDIDTGKGFSRCEYFAAALSRTGIEDMTDDQLCKVQQQPIVQWLRAEHVRDLEWTPYNTTDPLGLDKSLIESTISVKDLPKFAKGISNSLDVMKKLSDEDNFIFKRSTLNFSGRNLYVLQLEQKRCPNVIGWSDVHVGKGLYLDEGLQHGVGKSLLMRGVVIRFFDAPATLNVTRKSRDAQRPAGISAQIAPIIWDPSTTGGAGTRVECEVFIPSNVSVKKEMTHG